MKKKEHKSRPESYSSRSFGYNGLGFPSYSVPYSMVDNGCMNSDQFSNAQAPVDANSGVDSGVAPGY